MQQQQEGWEHQESVDDNIIEGDDFDTEVTIYQGKPYPTINAYFALATKLGMTIDEVVEKETDTEWVVRCRACWTVDGEFMYRWGAAADRKNDRHGYAKAWGKAQRNAFKGFLRGHPEMKNAIQEFTKSSNTQQALESPATQHQTQQNPPTTQRQAQEEPPAEQSQNDEITPRIKASQALARRKPSLETDHHINAKVLAAATEHHYGMTLDELPESAWREVEILLNTNEVQVFKDWIEQMRQDDQAPNIEE